MRDRDPDAEEQLRTNVIAGVVCLVLAAAVVAMVVITFLRAPVLHPS